MQEVNTILSPFTESVDYKYQIQYRKTPCGYETRIFVLLSYYIFWKTASVICITFQQHNQKLIQIYFALATIVQVQYYSIYRREQDKPADIVQVSYHIVSYRTRRLSCALRTISIFHSCFFSLLFRLEKDALYRSAEGRHRLKHQKLCVVCRLLRG